MRKNWRSKIDKETSVKYTIDYSESETLSPWAYFGLSVLYAIPVVGTVFLILACMSNKNKNTRNFARSFLLCSVLVIVLFTVFVILVRNNVIPYDKVSEIRKLFLK